MPCRLEPPGPSHTQGSRAGKHVKRGPEPIRGHLIVFEGPDGVGKTTLSKQLVAALRRRRVMATWFSFPGHEPGTLGAEIYALHHARRWRDIDPLSRQFLHLAAHFDLIQRRILPALRQGRWVVLDRYWWSTFVYGTAAGAAPKALTLGIQAERLVWGKIQPTLTFLIERPIRGGRPPVRLRDLYRVIARREGGRHPVEIVQNNQTIAFALEKIADLVLSVERRSR